MEFIKKVGDFFSSLVGDDEPPKSKQEIRKTSSSKTNTTKSSSTKSSSQPSTSQPLSGNGSKVRTGSKRAVTVIIPPLLQDALDNSGGIQSLNWFLKDLRVDGDEYAQEFLRASVPSVSVPKPMLRSVWHCFPSATVILTVGFYGIPVLDISLTGLRPSMEGIYADGSSSSSVLAGGSEADQPENNTGGVL
jgi:hypothetical protein